MRLRHPFPNDIGRIRTAGRRKTAEAIGLYFGSLLGAGVAARRAVVRPSKVGTHAPTPAQEADAPLDYNGWG